MAGEAPGGDHNIIALLPQSGRTDAVHLPPDVVPEWLEIVDMYISVAIGREKAGF